MNSQGDRENEMQRRERELRERENAIRLRELEAEIYAQEPPLHKTVKHEQSENKWQLWRKKLVFAGKLLLVGAAAFVGVQVAAQLTGLVIVGVLGWLCYKLFLDSKKD